MTDLLTLEDVREGLALSEGISPKHSISSDKFQRLCRDYLTLWDRVEKFEKAEKMALEIIEATEALRDD